MGGWEAPWHWIVLAIVVIALFGYKKLPDAARSVGRSLRIFKAEMKGMNEDDRRRESADVAPKQVEGAVPAQPPVTPVTPGTPGTPGTVEPAPPPVSARPPVNVNGTPVAPVADPSSRPGSSSAE